MNIARSKNDLKEYKWLYKTAREWKEISYCIFQLHCLFQKQGEEQSIQSNLIKFK